LDGGGSSQLIWSDGRDYYGFRSIESDGSEREVPTMVRLKNI